MPAPRTRILIAEDSASAVRVLTNLISKEPSFEIITTVNNGRAAVKAATDHKPDLILMDINMPVMDGLEATNQIMADCPAPILILTSKASVAANFSPYQAISLGAVDSMEKPDQEFIKDPRNVKKFLALLKTVSSVKVVRHIKKKRSLRDERIIPASASNIRQKPTEDALQRTRTARAAEKGSAKDTSEPASPPPSSMDKLVCDKEIVAIASSTGGPRALQQLLSELPAHFPVPIVIVQHTLRGFMDELISWLSHECDLKVAVAKDRGDLVAGTVYFCPDNAFISIGTDKRTHLIKPRSSSDDDTHILSGNSLLSSVAKVYGKSAIGIVLTGMGDDGALGLKNMRDAGALTIAQDESTSTVYGMPKVAADLDAANYILPINMIAKMVNRLTHCRGKRNAG